MWLPLSLPYRRGEGQKMLLRGLETRRVQHSLCDKKPAVVPWDSLTKGLPLSQIQTKLLRLLSALVRKLKIALQRIIGND